jgi:hypothetical protein
MSIYFFISRPISCTKKLIEIKIITGIVNGNVIKKWLYAIKALMKEDITWKQSADYKCSIIVDDCKNIVVPV